MLRAITMKKIISIFALSAAMLAAYAYAAEPQRYDFGDASDPGFPSLLANNGARHQDTGKIWLGTSVNAEVDALVSDRDAGDDGLISSSPIKFRVTADPLPSTPRPWYMRWLDALLGRSRRKAYVNILIDRNNNGAWEPTEWVVQNQSVTVPRGQSLEFAAKGIDGAAVAWNKETDGWMRITLTGNQLRNYDGTTVAPFAMGETEDYAPTNAPEETLAVWCFVDTGACKVLSKDEANEARDNKQALQGPYNTIAACMLDCKKKPPVIETPTPRRKMPPEKPVEKPLEKPLEKTVTTKSPLVPVQQNTTTCFLAAAPADFYPDGPDEADPQILTLRCTADSPSGVVGGMMTVLRRRLSDRPANQYPVIDNRIQGTSGGGSAACGGVVWSGEVIGNASVCITAPQ